MAQMEQLSWEYLVDHLNEDGILALLRWARRDAPDLLKELMLAFLGERTSSVSANGSVSASPEEVSLDAVERAHIARVMAASDSLGAAATKLGIHSTKLWRKRKLYGLR